MVEIPLGPIGRAVAMVAAVVHHHHWQSAVVANNFLLVVYGDSEVSLFDISNHNTDLAVGELQQQHRCSEQSASSVVVDALDNSHRAVINLSLTNAHT